MALPSSTPAGRRSEDSLRSILDSMGIGVYVKDQEGRYVFVNLACASFLGRPIDAIVGATDAEIMSSRAAEAITKSDKHVARTGESRVYEELI